MSPSILNATYKLLSQHPEVVAELSKRLRLPYLETNDNEGNVCFINSEEVRPEFRQVFTSQDVAYYLVGLFDGSAAIEISKENFHLNIPYPQNANAFWQKAELGRLEKI